MNTSNRLRIGLLVLSCLLASIALYSTAGAREVTVPVEIGGKATEAAKVLGEGDPPFTTHIYIYGDSLFPAHAWRGDWVAFVAVVHWPPNWRYIDVVYTWTSYVGPSDKYYRSEKFGPGLGPTCTWEGYMAEPWNCIKVTVRGPSGDLVGSAARHFTVYNRDWWEPVQQDSTVQYYDDQAPLGDPGGGSTNLGSANTNADHHLTSTDVSVTPGEATSGPNKGYVYVSSISLKLRRKAGINDQMWDNQNFINAQSPNPPWITISNLRLHTKRHEYGEQWGKTDPLRSHWGRYFQKACQMLDDKENDWSITKTKWQLSTEVKNWLLAQNSHDLGEPYWVNYSQNNAWLGNINFYY